METDKLDLLSRRLRELGKVAVSAVDPVEEIQIARKSTHSSSRDPGTKRLGQPLSAERTSVQLKW